MNALPHVYVLLQVTGIDTKCNSGVSLPLPYIFVCLLCFKGMRVQGKRKQKSDRHLLRFFFPSPDLKLTLFSGPDCHLSPLCKQL